MEIILSKQCEYLTGSLGRGFGYHIQRRTENRYDLDGTIHFWGVRQSKGDVPPDGHWKFILSCANLAQNKLYITDVKVTRDEVRAALIDAGIRNAADYIAANLKDFPTVFHVDDIFNLKNKYNL